MSATVHDLLGVGVFSPNGPLPDDRLGWTSLIHLPTGSVRFVAMRGNRIACGLRVIDCTKLNSSPISIPVEGTNSSPASHRSCERTPCSRESADAGEQLSANEFARTWHAELDKLEANVARLGGSFRALFDVMMWGGL